MTSEFLLFLLIGAALGGFVSGLAGFGTALFALGWWLQIMPASEAVALCLVVSMLSGSPGLVMVRNSIDWRALNRFLIPAVFGIPLGLVLLEYVSSHMLMWVIAVFMLVYGIYFGLRKNLPKISGPWITIDICIGFTSGVLGALAGLSGALPTMWLSLRRWPKLRVRGILQPFNMIVLLVSAAGLFIQGAYTTHVLRTIVVAMPATICGAMLGIWVFGKMDDSLFQRTLIALMALSGFLLMMRLLLSPN
ncbi:MAG: sulfite exporter TauE/SafE family protein [Rhizobiaceae bacterium]